MNTFFKPLLSPQVMILLFLSSPSVMAKPPEPEAGKRWATNTVFSDEFNGTTLDKSKWLDHHSTWKGRAPAKFEPAAVSVQNGSMQIKNHKLAEPDGAFTIAAGAVQSLTKTAYHGYYEARFKASRTNMSTTFWLSNHNEDLSSPNNLNADCDNDEWSMELDIAESVGGVINQSWGEKFRTGQQYNVHVWYSDCNNERNSFAKGVNAAEGDGSLAADNQLPNGEEVWQDFNTYATWWKNENEVEFFLNDTFSGKVDVSTALHDKPYSRPMGMQMLTETYNWATPYPTDTELQNDNINTSYYDWVRSYYYVDVDEVITKPETGLITNAGFESGDLNGWVGWGGSPREVVGSNVYSGDFASHVVGGGAIERTVSLLANTQYTITAYANVVSGSLNMGAKTNNATGTPHFGATIQALTNGYEEVKFTFNTGAQESIKLFFYAQSGSEFYVDDISLEQINPAPIDDNIDASIDDIYTENLELKNQTLTDDNLALAFLYQTNQDRDAEIIIYDNNVKVISKKLKLQAGYGHYLADVDLSNNTHLTNPAFEINLMATDEATVLTTTGKITLTPTDPPEVPEIPEIPETLPNVTITSQNLSNQEFNALSGESLVLSLLLNSDAEGAQLDSLTFKAAGDINDKTDVKSVKLYHDINNNGIPDNGELLGSGNYEADNANITLSLNEIMTLQQGNTPILLSYTF